MKALIRILSEWIARGLESAWRRRADSKLAAADISSVLRVRISNLNYALVPFASAMILVGLVILLLSVAKKDDVRSSLIYLVAIGAMAALAFVVGACRVLWVDLTDEITFRWLLRSKKYDRSNVEKWGFEIARGRYSQVAPASDSNFLLSMKDGSRFEVIVSPTKAQRIADVMQMKDPPARGER